MTSLALFHRVKNFDAWRKTAGFTAPTPARTALCLETWKQIKTAAKQDPQGLAAGLARYALDVWAEAPNTKTAFDRTTREDYATCFAAAGAVDQAIEALVKQGSLTPQESHTLFEINAVQALDTLEKLSGISEILHALSQTIQKHPVAIGSTVGTGIGAGLGAWKDDDNRLRGALSGGVGGAAIGGLVGHGLTQHLTELARQKAHIKKSSLGSLAWSKMSALEDPMQGTPPAGAAPPSGAPVGGGPPPDPTGAAPAAPGSPTPNAPPGSAGPSGPSGSPAPGLPSPENTTPGDPGAPEPLGQSPEEAMAQQAQQQEEQMAKEYHQHNTMVDNLSFLAQQVGLPSLAQEIEGTRNDLVQHFAAGNQHLPHNLQKYFPQSEHAKQFIEKYKARFAPITGGAGGKGGGGGAKKAASQSNLLQVMRAALIQK